jgi:uncharacterized membrane protein
MTDEAARPRFAAVLTPNEPLSPLGLGIVMGVLAGVSFVAGIAFMMAGAWPVTCFFGLDVLLVWLALRASLAAARKREEVVLTASELVVRRMLAGRPATELRLPRLGLRVELENEDADFAGRLFLRRGRQRFEFGSFLSEPDRRSLAIALSRALAGVRV